MTHHNTATYLDSMQEITLKPIGVVISQIKTPTLKTDKQGLKVEAGKDNEGDKRPENLQCELHISEKYSALLDGVENFSHLLVLYWPHLIDQKRRQTLQKVHPMGRQEIPEQGIFATCSPTRPNPILVTACTLLKRKNHVLWVKDLEAVDGSPIIDIKVYNPRYYRPDNVHVADWMQRIFEESDYNHFT